ncbi:MAG: hypothetical protein HC778_03350 [Chamaesiphon sp. CSU_1_12]|nr:hypothetical protein [Chamaesiphon sp. CSU_1_12]
MQSIGKDIQFAGANILDSKFPAIEIIPNTDVGAMPGSSKLIVRTAMSTALTLCQINRQFFCWNIAFG